MVNDDANAFFVQALQEVRFPVVISPCGEPIIHHPLNLYVRHRADHVRMRRTELPQRFEDTFARFNSTIVTNEDDQDALSFGRGHKSQEGAQLIRTRTSKVVIELDCLGGLVEPVNQRSSEHRSDRVKPKFEGGGNTEIPPTPAQSPEKILVPGLARCTQLSFCGHDVNRDRVVAGAAVPAPEPPKAATERSALNTRRRNETTDRCQPESLRFSVKLSPRNTRFSAHCLALRIDPNAFHR